MTRGSATLRSTEINECAVVASVSPREYKLRVATNGSELPPMSLEDQFIAPAPWPAAVALLFVMGVMELGFQLARLFSRTRAMKPYEYAATFLITLAAISAVSHVADQEYSTGDSRSTN